MRHRGHGSLGDNGLPLWKLDLLSPVPHHPLCLMKLLEMQERENLETSGRRY